MNIEDLTGNQLKVWLFIAINQDVEISLTEFEEALGIDKRNISKYLKLLIKNDLIERQKGQRNSFIYGCKNMHLGVVKTYTLGGVNNTTLYKNTTPECTKIRPPNSVKIRPLSYIKELLNLAKLSLGNEGLKKESSSNALSTFKTIHPIACMSCIEQLELAGASADWAVAYWGEENLRSLLKAAQKINTGNRLGFIWSDYILSRGRVDQNIKPLGSEETNAPEEDLADWLLN